MIVPSIRRMASVSELSQIKKLLDPAVYVTFVLFGVAFVNIFIINVMLGQPVRSMTLVKVGYVLNCLIGFISTMCCVIFGVGELELRK